MAQDKDRKELLEEPDPVTIFLHRLFAFLVTHRNRLIAGGITLAVVVIVVSGVGYFLNQAENKAATMLGQALEEYGAAKEGSGAPPDYEKLKADFKAVIDQYGYTDAADLAMVQYASVLHESGDNAAAIEMFQKAYDTFEGKAQIDNLVLNGMAYAYEAKGDVENAVSCFEKIVADNDAIIKDQALFNLGRLYGQLGKADESRGAYEKIVSDYPDSLYVEPAKMKIAG